MFIKNHRSYFVLIISFTKVKKKKFFLSLFVGGGGGLALVVETEAVDPPGPLLVSIDVGVVGPGEFVVRALSNLNFYQKHS